MGDMSIEIGSNLGYYINRLTRECSEGGNWLYTTSLIKSGVYLREK